MKIRQPWVLTSIGLLLGYIASPASAAELARSDFDAPAIGNLVTNVGVGPSGILLNGATVSNGVLNVDGLGQGLDIPLSVLNPFAGNVDWRVAFDFLSEDVGGGPLFSSDSSDCDGGCNDGEQAGSINIFLTDGGEVIADAWFIGAIGTEPGFNDGQMHGVELSYTAGNSLWELFIDGELADDADWDYSRDASQDRSRVGDQSNPDFGFEDIDPGMDGIVAMFDLATTPISTYSCPTRREPKQRKFNNYDPWRNAWTARLPFMARGDYAFCGGDGNDEVRVGPASYEQGDSPEYAWPGGEYNGVCFQRSVLNLRRIEDGTSKSYLGGEKYLKPSFYESGESWGDDACYYTGVDHDNLRWAGDFPARDQEGLVAPWIFGSAHPGGFQMVMCDGSVHNIPFEIDIEIHRNLANRRDGEVATLPLNLSTSLQRR